MTTALDDAGEKFELLLDELQRWNRKINLTAVRDRDEMKAQHILDSLSVQPLLRGERILDVGTGAGFPGLPLAIVEPHRHFDLIDSNNRKIQFVRHVAGLIGLTNVQAVQVRAEDYAPGYRFDTVIARAVASISRLLELGGQHVGEDGLFIALKGRYPADELEAVPDTWEYSVREICVQGMDRGSRHAVLLEHR